MNTNKQTRMAKLAARFAAVLLLVLTAIAFNSGGIARAAARQDVCSAMNSVCKDTGGQTTACGAVTTELGFFFGLNRRFWELNQCGARKAVILKSVMAIEN
jgi:hypothetical protein